MAWDSLAIDADTISAHAGAIMKDRHNGAFNEALLTDERKAAARQKAGQRLLELWPSLLSTHANSKAALDAVAAHAQNGGALADPIKTALAHAFIYVYAWNMRASGGPSDRLYDEAKAAERHMDAALKLVATAGARLLYPSAPAADQRPVYTFHVPTSFGH